MVESVTCGLLCYWGFDICIAGSLYPDWGGNALYSAVLYIVGSSCGVLALTSRSFVPFATHMSLSLFGNVIGSFASVTAWCAGIGPWGFIVTSLFIGTSHLWKPPNETPKGRDIRASVTQLLYRLPPADKSAKRTAPLSTYRGDLTKKYCLRSLRILYCYCPTTSN